MITSSLIPSLNNAIEFFIKFADGQEDPFATGTSVSAMESAIAKKWKELKDGSNHNAAETVFTHFRSDSQTALNTVRSSRTLFGNCFLKIFLFTVHWPCQ
jgi:hypothetical protein